MGKSCEENNKLIKTADKKIINCMLLDNILTFFKLLVNKLFIIKENIFFLISDNLCSQNIHDGIIFQSSQG